MRRLRLAVLSSALSATACQPATELTGDQRTAIEGEVIH
jgi:hypothetical protein